MEVNEESTRSDSGVTPEAPAEDVGSEAMKAAIAHDLFGDIATPLRVGRYQVREALGEGGMGVVYSAWDESLGRAVALKLLSAKSGKADRRRTRMMREAQALAKLSHPNVVQVYEVGVHDEDVFVAMELVEGLTLREWVQQSERSTREIEDVFAQAGTGLSAAHQRDLVHRDFKPSNVIVGSDGRVRVVDFGLAYGPGLGTESVEPDGTPTPSGRLTRTGAVMGTPAYMAPEQLRGEVADARADQFSFCVSLFEALTGSRPYPYTELRDDPTNANVANWGSVPRRWRRPLQRGLAIDPGLRWPKMDALLKALERGRGWRRQAPWLATAGGVGLVLWAPWSTEISDPCEDFPASPVGWNDIRAERVGAAFSATGAPFAEDVWASARGNIESFTKQWSETREKVCRSNPPPEALACLTRAETVLEAVLAQYESVNPSNVGAVHPLSTLLESPGSCSEHAKQAFFADVAPAQLSGLTKARAQLAATRADAALATLEDLADDPQLQTTDAIAEVFRLRSQGHAIQADNEAAIADLAHSLREASGPFVHAQSLVSWIRLLVELERYESARDGLKLLEPSVSESSPASLRADVLELQATLLPTPAEPSVTLLEAALRLRLAAGDEVAASRTRMAIANTLSESDDPKIVARGEQVLREIATERKQTLGAAHPAYAVSLFNLAVFLADEQYDWGAAERLLREADEIEGRALDIDAPARARTRLKLGEVLIRLDRLDEAKTMLDSAWARLRSLPPTHSDHVAGRTLLASFTLNQGDYPASLKHHRALEQIANSLFIQQNIAYLCVQLGQTRGAALAVARARVLTADAADMDDATRELLELYFRAVDAQVAHLEGRPASSLEIIEQIESAAASYQAPDDRPDLAAQLELLQPELDALRGTLSP